MDAMSDAIEGAAVMLFGVSLAYKESANVRSQAEAVFHVASLLTWSALRIHVST